MVFPVPADVSLRELAVLRERFAAADPAAQFIIDLSEIHYFGSALLGVLLVFRSRVREAGGSLRFVASHANIRRLLTIAGIDVAREVFDSVELAKSA